jgi:hypothetical protein
MDLKGKQVFIRANRNERHCLDGETVVQRYVPEMGM